MTWLILSILFNGFIAIIFKIFSRYEVNNTIAISINYVVCILTASVLLGDSAIQSENFKAPWLYAGLLLGLFLPLVFNLFAFSVKHLGIISSTIFQKMSMVAAVLFGIMYYNEAFDLTKGIGIVLALLAITLVPQGGQKVQKGQSKYLLAGLFVFIGSGIIDAAFLYVDKEFGSAGSDIRFVATLFFFAFIVAIPLCLIEFGKNKKVFSLKNTIAGIVLGVPNFFSIYFIMKALDSGLDGSQFFPINNVGILLLASVISLLFFNERLNKSKIVGFVCALGAILLLQ